MGYRKVAVSEVLQELNDLGLDYSRAVKAAQALGINTAPPRPQSIRDSLTDPVIRSLIDQAGLQRDYALVLVPQVRGGGLRYSELARRFHTKTGLYPPDDNNPVAPGQREESSGFRSWSPAIILESRPDEAESGGAHPLASAAQFIMYQTVRWLQETADPHLTPHDVSAIRLIGNSG